MHSLIFPSIAVCISLGGCLCKLISTPASTNGGRDKSSSLTIDTLMNNKNNGINGHKYSTVLDGCEFNYTGWKREK